VKAAHIFLGGYYVLCQVNLGTDDEYLKSSEAIQFEEKVDHLLEHGIPLPRDSSEVITAAGDVHYVLFCGEFGLKCIIKSFTLSCLLVDDTQTTGGQPKLRVVLPRLKSTNMVSRVPKTQKEDSTTKSNDEAVSHSEGIHVHIWS
jgi:hypothetical protein